MDDSILLKIGLYTLFFGVIAAMILAAALAMLFFIPFVALKAAWVLACTPFHRNRATA